VQQWHVFATVYEMVNALLDGILDGAIAGLTTWVVPVLLAAAVAYIGWQAIAWTITGQMDPARFVPVLLRIAIVITAVSSVGNYHQWVGDVMLQAPQELMNAVAGTNASAPDRFDKLWSDSWVGAQRIFAAIPTGWSDIGRAIIIGIIILLFLVVACVAIAYSFLVTLVALLTLKFGVALGPLFVACFAFPFTRRMGDNWLGVIASAVVTIAGVAVLLEMLVAVQEPMIAAVQAPPAALRDNVIAMTHSLFNCGIVFFIVGVLVRQVPAMARAIAGGVATRVEPYQHAAASAAHRAMASTKTAATAARGTARAVGARLNPAGRSRSIT
jgi:type IV secretion system protein VirB6